MRCIILTLLAVIGVTVGLQLPAQLDSAVQFISRDDLEQLKNNNPDLELIPLEAQQTKEQIRYTIGNRVTGDRLVAQVSNSQYWGTSQDIRLTLRYPTSGEGAVISYVSVTVQQSSNTGEGYVVAGGVGQRNILVYIDAYSTTYFSYLALVYGI